MLDKWNLVPVGKSDVVWMLYDVKTAKQRRRYRLGMIIIQVDGNIPVPFGIVLNFTFQGEFQPSGQNRRKKQSARVYFQQYGPVI